MYNNNNNDNNNPQRPPMPPTGEEGAHIPGFGAPRQLLPPPMTHGGAAHSVPFTYHQSGSSSSQAPARQDGSGAQKPFNMATHALQPHQPHPTLHVDTSASSSQSNAPRPPEITLSSGEPPTKATSVTSVSHANRPPPPETKENSEALLSAFMGDNNATLFREYADMDIACPGLGVDRLLVESIHEFFVKRRWFSTAKALQQEALGTLRGPRKTAFIRREMEITEREVMAKPPPPWPPTEHGAMYNSFEKYCRVKLFPAARMRQATCTDDVEEPETTEAESSRAVVASSSGQVAVASSGAQAGAVKEAAEGRDRHGGSRLPSAGMASGSGSRGNPILVDLTSPHRRTVSADHAHNRAVDDLIEEERERQALFYSASQSNASASTSGAGSSRPNTSDGLSQPSSRDPRGRPDGGRQRANTASGGLHMYKLPTVMEESPTEGTNRLPLQPPGPGSSRPRLPLSASDPTITASAAHPHHAHASHSHLRPDLGVSSSTASASTTSGPGRITRRYSKRKSVTTSKLKTGVIDKGKGVEPEDDLTRNKGKGKAVEAVLERRRSKGKGKATEMNTQAESGRPKKADDVLTFPARPDTRWPGLDLHDFYKEHRADEVEAMKVTGMKRLTPPIVPMAEDQIDQQAPDAGEMAIVEAEEFQLLPNHQVHNFGPGPSLAQAHGGNSPVDTVMGSADYAVGDLAGVLNYDTWIRSQIANDPNGVAGLQDVPLPLESYVSAQLAQQSAPPVSAPGMPASSLPMASQTPLSASVPQWHAPHLFSDLQTELHGNLSPNPAWDDVLSFFDPTLYQSPMVPLQDPQFRTERTMSAENWQLLRQGGVPDVPSGSESSVPYVPPSSHLGTVAPQSYQQFGDTGPSTQVQLHQQFGASGPSTQPQPLQHQAGTGPSTEPQLQQQFVDPGVFNQVQQQGGQPQLADAGQINQLQQQPHFADPGVFNQNQPAQQPQFADTGHLTQVQQQPQFANPGVFTQDQPAQQPQLGDEDQISEIQQQPQFDSEPFFIAVGAQEPFSTMGWDAHMRLAARRGGGQGRGRGQ